MNRNTKNDDDFSWKITENYPKAAAISDNYLIECEKLARETANDMLKLSETVPSGLTILIIGGLLTAQMPYWWQPKLLLPLSANLLWILGFTFIGLAIFNKYYKKIPIKTSYIAKDSLGDLTTFWRDLTDDQQKSDADVCRDLNIFIRKNRCKNTNSFCEIVAKQHANIRYCRAIEWGGIILFGFSTFQVINSGHQQHILNEDQKTSTLRNVSIENQSYFDDRNNPINSDYESK